jgi:hypothetical protein
VKEIEYCYACLILIRGYTYKNNYDAEGRRVRKDEGTTEYYIRGAGGNEEVVVNSTGSQATYNTMGNDVVGHVKRNNIIRARYTF